MQILRALVVALLCVWSTGCESEHFRAETRLLENGSVERIVYQPLGRTPGKMLKDDSWQDTSRVPKAELAEHRRMPLRDLMRDLRVPIPSHHKSPAPYWMASSKFADAAAIPDHLEFEAPEGLSKGHLVRRLERREVGFITEWTWEETLTDAVTLTDHRLARNEAAEVAVAITLAACSDVWGPDYDLKNLELWLRQDLTSCFQELCDAFWEASLDKNKQSSDREAFLVRGAKILKRHGLDLFDAQQQLIKDQTEILKRSQNFLSSNLQRLVRDKNGQPLQGELLQDVLDTFAPRADDSKETRLSQAFSRATLAKFGGEELFEKQLNLLGTRIVGLYHWPLLHGERLFDYRLDVPGVLLETNGTLVGDHTLRWKFAAGAAFPLGYSMRAVSAVVNTVALAKHFPRAKFERREVIVEYLDLVDADADLRTALNELVLKNDPTAWKAWQVDHLNSTRLLELLQPKSAAGDAK